ncbi:LytTR family DNA-binding domain-containing protein [Paraliobacillus ryukyuensis]|uniref:LytTR family DNA-binding domain-containing protein n=1 Tax=Paraliobacillus ryukyuensis TaxID=200904 RepID=UPI002119634A|nr:LytTR family transcriptional regulator DNA-binding domain-containing protein [Paraliobacillus ryukyuensis]
MIFHEPVQGVDVNTTNSFIQLLQRLKACHIPVLVLVSNLEHAIMLGDVAYKLHQHALSPVEMDEGEDETKEEADDPGLKRHNNLFKIPAKVDDKVILFDPLEIDYMESQDGKAMIVVNDQTYAMDTTLSEMEKQLEVYGFYRCHRSYIVNLQKVREIITWSKNTYSLRIDNKSQSTIPLSRTKIQDIQEKFSLK